MKVIRSETALGLLEEFREGIKDNYQALRDAMSQAAYEDGAMKGFTLLELQELFLRGSPVGSDESDVLAVLEQGLEDGPLGRKLRREAIEEVCHRATNDAREMALTLLRRRAPVGAEESDFLAALECILREV